MESNIQRYEEWTEADADQESAEAAALSGNIYMKLEVGNNFLRFLPKEVGKPLYRMTSMHYVPPLPGSDQLIVFACPRVELKEPCIACQRAKALGSSPNPADRKLAEKISGGFRGFANVRDRRLSGITPRVLGFGKQILKQLKLLRKSGGPRGDFTNPGPSGFDLNIHREGSGQYDTEYTVLSRPNSDPLAPTQEEIDAICDERHDLNTCVRTVVPEELAAAWAGAAALSGRVTQVQVPRATAVRAQGAIGAELVGGRGATVVQPVSAASAEVAYDEDFNPVLPKGPEDDDIPF